MPLFDHPEFDHHRQVLFGCDPESGLKAIIAIHDTTLGPALGGLRIYPYASEEEALTDVLRLSRGMSYKSAMANLPLGGGKAVIIADPHTDKTPALLRAMGRLVESVGGLRRADGESGDPSPFTAWGVFCALKSAVRHGLGRDDLEGLRVAIQGVGHVGAHLARHLHAAGAELVLTDVNREALTHLAEELGAEAVAPEAIFDADVDLLAPCAMGAVLNDSTVERLKAKVVCGAANNQLATPAMAERLMARGILYTPDYVANAGGVIEIAWQRREDYDRTAVMAHIEGVGVTLDELFPRAAREGLSPATVADAMARERFGRG